ncbi:MAG: methyltransferase domain-containing protein [Actinomycetota bacterium]
MTVASLRRGDREGLNSISSRPCRSCRSTSLRTFLDLGETPLADALIRADRLNAAEPRFPLEMAFCPDCSLVQILEDIPPVTLFVDNYLYFSSFSDHLLAHARSHARSLVDARVLGPGSLVVEVASNDGYLLKNFAEQGIPVLGIDPAPGQAEAALAIGIPTLREFFGADLARRLRAEGKRADVIIANNVMAHVPDLNGFVEGMSILLAKDGVITIENPYVRELIDRCEFDTVYHEHMCYFSCTAVDRLMRRHGLRLNHVEEFPDLHGGTLRWHVSHSDTVSTQAAAYLSAEKASGLDAFGYYEDFAGRVSAIRTELMRVLQAFKAGGSSIAAYGAAAKGSTLLNYVGIDATLLDFVVDRNVHKQGLYMPGTRILVCDPAALIERRPDYVLLLAWNFEKEILAQQAEFMEGGGQFIVPVPWPKVVGAGR